MATCNTGVATTCHSLASGLLQLYALEQAVPIELVLNDGVYDDEASGGAISSGLLTINASIRVSSIILTAANQVATLRAPSGVTRSLLTVTEGAPPTSVRKLRFEESNAVPAVTLTASSRLEMSSCSFVSNARSAIEMRAGELAARSQAQDLSPMQAAVWSREARAALKIERESAHAGAPESL